MRKFLFLGVLLLLTACTEGNYQTAPDNADVYIVDSATVDGSFIVFSLRDVDENFVVPVVQCDGTYYEPGTIILVNDEYYVKRVESIPQSEILWGLGLMAVLLTTVVFLRKK